MTRDEPIQPEPRTGPTQFLDVPWLIEASEPRRPVSRTFLFLGGLMSVIVLSAVLTNSAQESARGAIEFLSGLLILLVMGGLLLASHFTVRRFRTEQQTVEGIGELVQLRRWGEAAAELDRYLATPAKTHGLRAQALLFLGAVLGRYQRFNDAITVFEHLLESDLLDGGAEYGVRLGRAMAMLREDHLVDADRAITELRRMTGRDGDPAGLGLLELYRDVKTGHADDAIVRFEKMLPRFRDSLGHRVGDTWLMAAWAYDRMNRPADAQRAYANATSLAPPVELFRRYPELKSLEPKYEPTYAPQEAA